MNDMNERINLNFDLSIISESICKEYGFGQFVSNEIITVGYEDFNYILCTSIGKYCVKIFNKDRTLKDCNSYIDRIKLSSEIGVNSPKPYYHKDEILYVFVNNDTEFRLCVFEFIDGSNFYDLNTIPTENEIKDLIRQMALIHKAKLDSKFIYDSWTLTNFKEEYEKKKQYLEEKDRIIVDDLRNKFDTVDFDKLEHTFVHGDIVSSNVMKDKTGRLWIIDYAVSNYLPRIVDLAVSAYNLCTDPNSYENTLNSVRLIISEYEKYNKLSDYEKEAFPIFFELGNGMGLLQTSYQKAIGNGSEENEFWLDVSRKGIGFSTPEFWRKILD